MGARAILRRDGARLVRGDLLPGGQKIRGMNLHQSWASVQARRATGESPVATWSYCWEFFEESFFQDCVDKAVAIGCNVLRIQGSVWVVYSGRMTREEYLANWKKLYDMCQKAGIWLYPCGCDGGVWDRFNDIPFSNLQTELTAWAAYMDTLPGVIALDLIQESTFASTSNAITLYNQVKTATTKLVTYSANSGTPTPGLKSDRLDFLDYHNYSTWAPTFLDLYWTSDTRPVVFGEFGLPADQGITGQSGYYGGMLNLNRATGALGQKVAGSLAWSIIDADDVANNQWGVHDLTGNPKWWLIDMVQHFGKHNEIVPTFAPIASPSISSTLLRDFDPQGINGGGSWHGRPTITLPDQSGNGGDLTQSNSVNRPLYQESITPNGKPGLRFYGSSISLANTTGADTTYAGLTIFHVVSQLAYAASHSRIMGATSAGGTDSTGNGIATNISAANITDFSQVSVSYDGTNKTVTLGANPFGSWVVLAYVIPSDGSSVLVYANGTLVATLAGTSNTKSLANVVLGRGVTSGSASGTTSNMFWARTLIYQGVLTNTDRNTITTFLRTTYGI